MEMPQTYPLEWLDSLISITLNPRKHHVCSITDEELMLILEKISEETLQIQIQLKKQFFVVCKESEIRLLVQKYHSALIILLNSVVDYKNDDLFKNHQLSVVIDTLVCCLEELLSFIETRFYTYLSIDERVPITYLDIIKKELKQKLDNLKQRLVELIKVDNINGIDVVFGVLYGFVFSTSSLITYREVLYRKELIKELETFCETPSEANIYSALDELLVYMNFNSIKYINYFKTSIIRKIALFKNEADRFDNLLFLFKEFSQLYSNENIRFNLKNQNLKLIITNWFVQEIAYLEKKMQQSIVLLKDSGKNLDVAKEIHKEEKITCLLSADQIGLILRASDESRILNAKSMSAVFKTIIPHLSTPYKSELSYHSVRSKSYNAEDKDKEIAIETLEKIIRKIRTY